VRECVKNFRSDMWGGLSPGSRSLGGSFFNPEKPAGSRLPAK
jgi:hypothetical protein